MKLIILFFGSFLVLTSYSQRNFRVGVGYSVGISSFYSTKTNGNDQLLNSDYAFKINQGASVKFQLSIANRWELFCQTGYQQRGVRFKNYLDDYDPRYRLNYWDVQLGTQFLFNKSASRKTFFGVLGITQHTLLSSKRVYDTSKDDLSDEFSKLDVGALIAIGYQIPVFQNQVIQLQATANFGYKQVYTNSFFQNGLRGNNSIFNLQLNYLF
jgi:hypothetical protein